MGQNGAKPRGLNKTGADFFKLSVVTDVQPGALKILNKPQPGATFLQPGAIWPWWEEKGLPVDAMGVCGLIHMYTRALGRCCA